MSCPNKKHIYRYMFRKPGPKYVHLQDLIMYIVRKACNVYFPSIYTHLKGHRLFMRHSHYWIGAISYSCHFGSKSILVSFRE
jgi:hypothetical protein